MLTKLKKKVFRTLIIGLSLTVLAPITVSAAEDPFEPLNRRIFEFNEGADAILLKPVAVVYNNVVPTPLRIRRDHRPQLVSGKVPEKDW